ncbi:hypothetical protein [Ruminococcus albus]|uniref:Uncharacterized protein n=1 Tax=Ruminococcus albus TaxID=1264 RepID=A0A1I1ECR1_RUMAL|nr:hypothetical protein [Ruminococcus albus]SFB84837.1 hypothetical protein SAMN02910406_00649 [Ruminococcus albus]
MKMKILTAAVISAMLTLTACGETDKADTTSDKPAETTTTTAASEEVTTEPVTEEVTTETTPAVETTVTTTTEATTTTEEIPPEPEKEEFKLAEGLSEKYVDFDNLALEFNGQIFRFDEATLQDLLDAGVELFTDADLDKQYANDVEAQVKITDSIRADLMFRRINGISGTCPREYVLDECSAILVNSPYDEITYGPNYGEGMVHLNIPLTLTKDDLFENSGEPLKVSNGSLASVMAYEYKGHSAIDPENSKYCSRISFSFYNDIIARFKIDAHEVDRD